MQRPFNFYVVFNPLLNGEKQNYKTQAHEFFYRLKENLSMGDPGKAHLYWGKLKMSSHQEELEFERFKQAHAFNQQRGLHTHLIISDFHHFWVAKVESVHREVFDRENTLPFYDGKDVEIWFKVTDMDLISSEYVETGYYLEQLYAQNDFCQQNIDSINPYLSGLRYPLIVQDKLAEQYFVQSSEKQGLRVLGNNPLIEKPAEFGAVASNVQTYVLPPAIYGKLSERVRKKLIAVEMEVYKKEKAPADLNKEIATTYLEILESALNDTFIRYIREETSGHGFGESGNVEIGELVAVLENPTLMENCNLDFIFKEKLAFLRFCRGELLQTLRDKTFLELQDKDARRDGTLEISQKDAMLMRNVILGVGCKGIINSLVCLFHENEFMDSYFRSVA